MTRFVAGIPVYLARPEVDWRDYDEVPGVRPEMRAAVTFASLNRERIFSFVTLARVACLPFSALCGYVIYRWSSELYGWRSGVLALSLWAFSPTVLGHGALITSDVAAAALALTTMYCAWKWLREPKPSLSAVFCLGIALGIGQLTKFTLVLLVPIIAVLAACRFAYGWQRHSVPLRQVAGHAVAIGLSCLYILNVGYAFEATCQPLGSFSFASMALGGSGESDATASESHNRFRRNMLAALPVPIPKNYVMGIDAQRSDFENKFWCYLLGTWQHGGWWYYYIIALAVKEPCSLAILLGVSLMRLRRLDTASAFDHAVLLIPAVLMFVVVSSQTGINIGVRYTLPVLPFVFVFAGGCAAEFTATTHLKRILVVFAICWYATSSLTTFPHSLSYFNELAGGPRNGHRILLDSNIDWGQDLFYIKEWADSHPEARPLFVDYYLPHIEPGLAGIPVSRPSPGLGGRAETQPPVGYHAISVCRLIDRWQPHKSLTNSEPIALVGYTTYIYQVRSEQ